MSLAVLALAVAGCGTQNADHSSGPEVVTDNTRADNPVARIPLGDLPTTPTNGLAKGLTLPLDAYTYSAKDRYVWQVAVQEQWRSCMQRYGFSAFAPPAPAADSVSVQTELGMGRRYGISDLATVQKYGYHIPDEVPESPRWEPAAGAEEAVFTGAGSEIEQGKYKGEAVPEGGCRGEASRMYPLPQTTEAEEAAARSFKESQSDPRVVEATAAWSTCMKGKGYTVEEPFKAADLIGSSLSAAEPSDEEIRIATADVTCKKETNLIQTWHQAEQEKQDAEIAKHQNTLSTVKKEKDAAVAKSIAAYDKGAE
ncbi:hypothetical protein [Streptomyces justiciae]|uniref:Lipoprotein n=1 Tax=Streptomyces justiciae TaxID=2780140 RepID=A0ABU3LN30_9ACTN|nr:hypothetical protein [Streptomyces justiciae]MDT7840169.1 hypothetical protein [Streptomyces justiciae]